MSADQNHEEAWQSMINVKRKLLALAMVTVVSAGVFAQRGEDKRPKKPPDTKVVVTDKEKPKNNNQDKPKNSGKRGKP
jgi:hypothetical protein